MNKEKVSIYIPAYNAEKTIKECINSVINQSKKFDDIIVIDDFNFIIDIINLITI